jgi:hypothetical protein
MKPQKTLSAEQQVVWLLHPVWGPWLAAGWDVDDLDAAAWWRWHGWEPAVALTWHRNEFSDPRLARRYFDMGWSDPDVCRVVIHLGKQHGLDAGSEARILDSGASLDFVDDLHRQLHEGQNEDAFDHEVRSDAAVFSFSVCSDGGVTLRRVQLEL